MTKTQEVSPPQVPLVYAVMVLVNASAPLAFWSTSSHGICPSLPELFSHWSLLQPQLPSVPLLFHLLTSTILELLIPPTELVLTISLVFSRPLFHMRVSYRVSHHLSFPASISDLIRKQPVLLRQLHYWP